MKKRSKKATLKSIEAWEKAELSELDATDKRLKAQGFDLGYFYPDQRHPIPTQAEARDIAERYGLAILDFRAALKEEIITRGKPLSGVAVDRVASRMLSACGYGFTKAPL